MFLVSFPGMCIFWLHEPSCNQTKQRPGNETVLVLFLTLQLEKGCDHIMLCMSMLNFQGRRQLTKSGGALVSWCSGA